MSNIVRQTLSQTRRISLTAKRNDAKSKQLEKVDTSVDEKFHFLPFGKSDTNVQTRVSFISKDMDVDNKKNLFSIVENTAEMDRVLVVKDTICLSTISTNGFRLSNSQFLFGPIAVFPKTALSWRVASVDEITPESMGLFLLLQPKLDILIVGAGDKKNIDKVNARVAPILKANKISYEVLSTEFAIPTFNFLNDDGRFVAAALFPPEDLIISQYEHGKAMLMVRNFDESEISPLMLGHNVTPDIKESLMEIFLDGRSSEEKAEFKKRVLVKREENRQARRLYFDERRERVEEERLLALADAKENLRKLEEQRERMQKIDSGRGLGANPQNKKGD